MNDNRPPSEARRESPPSRLHPTVAGRRDGAVHPLLARLPDPVDFVSIEEAASARAALETKYGRLLPPHIRAELERVARRGRYGVPRG